MRRSEYAVNDVPFVSQAPFGEWSDTRMQDGCEEASTLMAVRWVEERSITKSEAKEEIIAMSEYQLEEYGSYNNVE